VRAPLSWIREFTPVEAPTASTGGTRADGAGARGRLAAAVEPSSDRGSAALTLLHSV